MNNQTDDWIDELLDQMGYTQNKDSRRLARGLIEAKVIRGRIEELGALLSIFTTNLANHEQIISLQQAKDRFSKLQAELAEVEK